MKINEHWLREYVSPSKTIQEIAEQLTMAGLEVDHVFDSCPEFTGVLVGHVVKREQHPDADRLSVCEVNVGEADNLQIVCGAPNVRDGLKVAVATIGAVLPGHFKIKKSKLRGVPSQGMICSVKELELADESDGIWELPEGAEVGQDLREYLNLHDMVMDVELTPNRGDCLSVQGIAREVGLLNQADITAPTIEPVAPQHDQTLSVAVVETAMCPRYVGRVITGVNPKADTPLWMRERLRRCGLRSISPVVDVTNYVMLELGQPMHAFDLHKINNSIIVRKAAKNEKLTLLDGQEVDLRDDTLVIADEKTALAIAGVMGGESSSVTDDTTDIFLEVAFFAPEHIAGVARSYALHTDSSHRFERGVDPQLQTQACERATALLLDIVGGEAGPLEDCIAVETLPHLKTLELRKSQVKRLLGIELDEKVVVDIFTRLGMKVEILESSWKVAIPSYRFDMDLEVDLLEELARVYGYNNLPSNMPQVSLDVATVPAESTPLRRLADCLIDRGYQEVVGYSFVEEAVQKQLKPEHDSLPLLNPISSEMGVMRTTLWSSLLPIYLHNYNRQQKRAKLYETGLRFVPDGEHLYQHHMLAGLIAGPRLPEQWGSNSDPFDFYDLKADVEALLSLTHKSSACEFSRIELPSLHPGQSAQILYEDEHIGVLGALHPGLLQALGLEESLYLFELDLMKLSQVAVPTHKNLSKFPAIRRDLAILVGKSVEAQALSKAIWSQAGDSLQDITLFDVYEGKGVAEDEKSLAIGLTLQHATRTLTDKEVNKLMDKLVTTLKDQFNATLRM